MPSLLEQLNALLADRDAATSLAARIGGSAEDAEAAIGPALARIIDGLATLAADEGGTTTVRHLVDHHDRPQAEELDDHLDRAPTESGNVVLDRVFGAERGLVVIGLAGALGLAPSLVGRLLPLLAPLVTAEVARRRDAEDLDEQGMARLLSWDQRAIAQAGLLDGTTFDGLRPSTTGSKQRGAVASHDRSIRSETTTIDLELPGRAASTGTLAMLETSVEDAVTPTIAEATDVQAPAATPTEDDTVEVEQVEGPADELAETERPETGGPSTAGTEDGETGDGETGGGGAGEPIGEDAAPVIETAETETAETKTAETKMAETGTVERVETIERVQTPEENEEAKVAALAWLGWAVGAVVLVLLLAWLLSTCGAATEQEDQAATVINIGRGDADPDVEAAASATVPASPEAGAVASTTPSNEPGSAGPATTETIGGAPDTGAQTSTGSGSVTEAELQGAVNAILRDSGVSGEVDGGRVVLAGIVEDEETRDWLEANVSVLLGVSAIDNQVTIGAEEPVADQDPGPEPESNPESNPEENPGPDAGVDEADGTEAAIDTSESPAEVVPAGTTLNDLLDLQPVTFASGSPELTDGGRAVLDRVATYLLDHPDLAVEIGGHTDDDGAEDANQELSQNRAEAVQTLLVEAGVAADRLTAVGFGETKPAVANDSADNKAINRRIDFTVR